MLNISALWTVGIVKGVVRALGLWGIMSVIENEFFYPISLIYRNTSQNYNIIKSI